MELGVDACIDSWRIQDALFFFSNSYTMGSGQVLDKKTKCGYFLQMAFVRLGLVMICGQV